MMEAALRGADAVILTSDNPRSEDPRKILDDALSGADATQRTRVTVQPDRAEAIRHAMTIASADDTVLIAGKGHENYQIIAEPPGSFGGKTRKVHFDDREQAANALQHRKTPRLAG
jgi:UDP-N-acetylmuramoyl-L-alanyl-D-glutamate--2,6-diaminopimelate ligase